MADIDRTMTPLPPLPPAEANGSAALPELVAIDATPPLVATTNTSPVFEALVSPALEAVDKLDLSQPIWRMPECWGHRGASASFPENTRMSFIEACKAGADGIETDIHITADNELVMFHDPELSRTTDGTGRIHSQPWHGVLEHVRTIKAPHQPIPRFSEVLDILMQPENMHVKVNIDCKVENDPSKLFKLIQAELARFPGWQTALAPRLVLGLWHPKFIAPAYAYLPLLRRYCISMSIPQVRQYFFDHCHGFSVWYYALNTAEGAKFRADCAAAGKEIATWTVNDRDDMLQCARWGIAAVISDKPELWREVKREVAGARGDAGAIERALRPSYQSYILPFFNKQSYWFEQDRKAQEELYYLERESGPFGAVTLYPPVA